MFYLKLGKTALKMPEIKQLTVIVLKGDEGLLGSFLNSNLGKLWLKVASVQVILHRLHRWKHG
jgi:hypothetical protein